MRKYLLSLMACLSVYTLVAQDDTKPEYKYRKGKAIGIHFNLHDFPTAQDMANSSLGSVLSGGDWKKLSRMNPGLGISYVQGLTDHLDLMARLGLTSTAYPIPDRPLRDEKLLLELDASVLVKLLTDRYVVSPFLSAGIGASTVKGYTGAFLPIGVGLQFNIFNQNFLYLQAQYRVGVTDATTANHLFYSFGIATAIGKKKVAAPPPPPPPPPPPSDRDQDGIVDTLDACPDVAGLAKFNGCPDTDNDGIQDKEDKCPTVAGLPKYQGCPIPDSDNDGINDEEDKCPNEAGLSRYQGCPIPDTDKDGVNDEEDDCPTEPGPADNKGCPKLEQYNFNAKAVQFATGSATLLKSARTELDELVTIMTEHPTLNVSVEGHTDNTGDAAFNQKLSQRRAEAVVKYLTGKGIAAERLRATGYGEEKPIADNKTAKGRSENRRVEFNVVK